MARISTYENDTRVRGHDKLIGTDGGQVGADGNVIAGTAGATVNFTIDQLTEYFGDNIPSSGSGGTTTQEYRTDTINGGLMVPIEPYTVTVISGGGVKNLPSPAEDGMWVRIVDLTRRSGGMVMLNAGMNGRIMNTDDPTLVLNNPDVVSFEMVYIGKPAAGADQGDDVGWVIVGAQS